MMVSLTDEQNFTAEKALLGEVFKKQTRADGDYYVYQYDQRYYKVLSACAKLRLRTKNLPEGNPNYIEVKATDWDLVFSGQAAAGAADSASNVRHISFETAKARDVKTLNPQTSALRHSNTVFDDGSLSAVEESVPAPLEEDMPDTAPLETVADIKEDVQQEAALPEPEMVRKSMDISLQHSQPVPLAPAMDKVVSETMEATYQARVASMKTRESALKTREDAIRIREEAIKAREEALQANEDEIEFSERTLKSKERVLQEKADQIKALEASLSDQKNRLAKQKKEIATLAEYLQQSADKLLADID